MGAKFTVAVRSAATHTAETTYKHLDDIIEEADTNTKQLASWSALSASSLCVSWSDTAYSAVLLGDALLFASTTPTPWVVLCVAPSGLDVAQLHRLSSSGIDAARSSVSGQGLTAYDPSDSAAARQQNVIYVVPRDVDGAIAEWATPADISLTLLPDCMASGLSLSYDVTADGDGWRVAYTVGRVSTGPTTISLQLDVNDVRLWQGDVRVRVWLWCCSSVLYALR